MAALRPASKIVARRVPLVSQRVWRRPASVLTQQGRGVTWAVRSVLAKGAGAGVDTSRCPLHTSTAPCSLADQGALSTVDLRDEYLKLCEAQSFKEDAGQLALVVNSLQPLLDSLQEYGELHAPQSFTSRISGWFGAGNSAIKAAPKGVYIWGSVGSGKTMIMDLFFSVAPVKKKMRAHFNEYMLDFHDKCHKWRATNDGDPIPDIAAELAAEHTLLCFDEFQVTDVADAMIMKRLFEHLFNAGVVVVSTSNRPPQDLYKQGLNRSHFLPFIPLLEERCHVVPLSSEFDYRNVALGSKELFPCYFTPLDDKASANIDALFTSLTKDSPTPPAPTTLSLWGRTLHVPQATASVARFDFDELCMQALSAADYLKIATTYDTIVLEGIPAMTMQHKDPARRFITLVDCLYDNQTRLVCSAAAEASHLFDTADTPDVRANDSLRLLMDDLKLDEGTAVFSVFTNEEERFAWTRTVSRLGEMRTAEYWRLKSEDAS